MEILQISQSDVPGLVPLMAQFRVTLRSYKGTKAVPNLPAAREELAEYLEKGFPVYAAKSGEEWLGFLGCRVEEPCVWVESIYVREQYRRQGVASRLFEQAERLAASYGEFTLFHYVHPNNHGMIGFLRSKGYTVLNLIEIRKPYPGEALATEIQVGEHSFQY